MISFFPPSPFYSSEIERKNFSGETDKSRAKRMGLDRSFCFLCLSLSCIYIIHIVVPTFNSPPALRIDKICYDNFDCLAYHSNESWAYDCVCVFVRVFFSFVLLNYCFFFHLYDNQHVSGKQIAMSKLN